MPIQVSVLWQKNDFSSKSGTISIVTGARGFSEISSKVLLEEKEQKISSLERDEEIGSHCRRDSLGEEKEKGKKSNLEAED